MGATGDTETISVFMGQIPAPLWNETKQPCLRILAAGLLCLCAEQPSWERPEARRAELGLSHETKAHKSQPRECWRASEPGS